MCSYLGIEQAFKPDWSTHRSHSRTDVCISKEAMQTLVWGCHRKLFFCSTSGFQVLYLENLISEIHVIYSYSVSAQYAVLSDSLRLHGL